MIGSRQAQFLIVVSATCAGCAAQITPPSLVNLGEHRVLNTNYTLGEQREVYVGQQVVRVHSVVMNRVRTLYLTPTMDFTVETSLVKIIGNKGKPYRWRGTLHEKSARYNVVDVQTAWGMIGLVVTTPEGRFTGRVIQEAGTDLGLFGETYEAIPMDVRFEHLTSEETVPDPELENYELVYTGTAGGTINLVYREFTEDNMARSAFFQNLVFDLDSPTIRFRNLQIEIQEATNQRLVYTVVSQ